MQLRSPKPTSRRFRSKPVSEYAFPSTLGGFDRRNTPALRADVLVIGGGIAGCSAALAAAAARRVESLAKLARPRIDVTLRISGFFRDAFPAQIELFDKAVRAIAG